MEANVSAVNLSSNSAWQHNRLSVDTQATLPNISFRSKDNLAETTSHRQVSTLICLDKYTVSSPGQVTGFFEVERLSHTCIRGISVELFGFEQTDDKHETLLRNLVIQGPDTAPTDAVEPGFQDSFGYFGASKGKTLFRFAFEIPAGLSSFHSKHGSVVYGVRSKVEVRQGKVEKICFAETTFDLVNVPKDMPPCEPQTKKSEGTWGLFGSRGTVNLTCELSSNVAYSGLPLYVKVQLDNSSVKKVNEISIRLSRKVQTFRMNARGIPEVTFHRKTMAEKTYPGSSFHFDAYQGRKVLLSFDIPRDLHSMTKGQLLEVQYELNVAVKSNLSKPVVTEFPIQIYDSMIYSTQPRFFVGDIPHYMPLAESEALEPELPKRIVEKVAPDSAYNSDEMLASLKTLTLRSKADLEFRSRYTLPTDDSIVSLELVDEDYMSSVLAGAPLTEEVVKRSSFESNKTETIDESEAASVPAPAALGDPSSIDQLFSSLTEFIQ